jgi:two-component system chemotaxis sensor kinase CheA
LKSANEGIDSMSGFEQLKSTFFDEASEGLVSLESGLTDLREGTGSEDTVHAIFRAVHSIKGGAGVFGFTDLIEFAHVFETVLDAVRRGSLATTPDVLDILFRANDSLSDLVGMARDGITVEPGFCSESRSALEHLIGEGSASEQESSSEESTGDSTAELDMEGFTFTPVRVDDAGDDSGTVPSLHRYSIAFRPKAEMIQKSIEPVFFLNTLRSMGKLDLVAMTDAMPSLSELRAEQAYIAWNASLETESSRQDLDAVFAPILNDCEVEINDLTPASESALVEVESPTIAAEQQEVSVQQSTLVSSSMQRELSPKPGADIPPSLAGSNGKAKAGTAVEEAGNGKESRASAAKAATTTIRVELEKIDRVVNMVGDLVIAQAMLGQVIESLPEETGGKVSNILADLVRHTRGLKDSVMAIRAQPVSSVFQRMPRLVRELSAKTGKKVQVEMSGETTEVDKTIIERLSDPLTHIIRNSIDHGIESPTDRVARGKNEVGTIRLSADQRGGRIVIEISDDGAGINCKRVLKKARDKGLVDPNVTLTEDEICNLIFMPGFSTAETVSDISGRGVGMDVVRRNIQDLGGRTSIKSEAGKGMTIQLALPLTLAVMDGMVVQVGSQTYVLPIPNIVECLRPSGNEIHNLLGTSGTLRLRGDIVPLMHLGDLLGVGAQSKDKKCGVVIITEASDGTRLGFVVDELCGHQQVVIKSIEENCGSVQGIAGATVLGDGHVAFILDVEMLSNMTCYDTSTAGAAYQRNAGASVGANVN